MNAYDPPPVGTRLVLHSLAPHRVVEFLGRDHISHGSWHVRFENGRCATYLAADIIGIAPSPVKCAAVSIQGLYGRGPNHGEIYSRLIEQGMDLAGAVDGFFDADDNFLSRAEAYERAVYCGQIREDSGERVLVSEMMVGAPGWEAKK